MGYFLLIALVFLLLSIVWGALGFGVRGYTLIKNEKIAEIGTGILLISCVFSWGIWIFYACGTIIVTCSSFISFLL